MNNSFIVGTENNSAFSFPSLGGAYCQHLCRKGHNLTEFVYIAIHNL